MNVTQASWTSKARTWLLLAALTALFIGIGYLIGGAALWLFVALSVLMNVAAYFWSDKFAIRASRAQPVSEEEAPDLHKMVNELAELYQVPKPRVYMIPSEQPNAFATGRSPKKSAVAVTEGLVQAMPQEEVRAVMAHEFAHIKNRDVLVTTVAAMIGAAIAAIAHFLQFSFLLGGDDDESPLGFVGVIAAIIVAPMAAMLLQLAVSRQREYLADATAAQFMGEGRPLASALESLKRGVQAMPMRVNPATEALYIANPLSGKGMSALFSTHPAIDERIRRLRQWDARHGIHY